MREDYLTGEPESLNPQEKEFDKALRPLSFLDFSGQGKIIDNLKSSINLLSGLTGHENSVTMLTSILARLETTDSNPKLIKDFWEYTYMLDQQRNQNFHLTFNRN